MNRRDAIKGLAALGAFWSMTGLAEAATPEFIKRKPLHIVGLGGGGCNALKFIHQQGVSAKYTFVNHPKRPNIAHDINFIEYVPHCYLKIEERGIFLSDRKQKMVIPQLVRKLFSDDHFFILLASLGGFTGTKMIEELSLDLHQNNRDFLAITSMPYAFEGLTNRDYAENTRTRLQHISGFKCFEHEELRTVYRDMKIHEAFGKGDEQFYKLLIESVPGGYLTPKIRSDLVGQQPPNYPSVPLLSSG